jgi:hypothetical protein
MTLGQVYVLGAGLTFLAIFVTGHRLSRLAQSRGTILLTAHKILGLCPVVLLVATSARIGEAGGLAVSDWVAVAVAGALCVVAIVSGGLISARADAPRNLRMAHRIASTLAMLASAVAIYFLLVRV